MATFLTRVELHDATYENYVQLHDFMGQEGFTATIRGGDGALYQLPPAEYHLSANCTIEDPRARASRAARKHRRITPFWCRSIAGRHGTASSRSRRERARRQE